MTNPMKDDGDSELFRLASLIGCEPEDEERHRKQLLEYVQAGRSNAALEAQIGTTMGWLAAYRSSTGIKLDPFIEAMADDIESMRAALKQGPTNAK